MPIYDYVCGECGEEVEVIQSIGFDKPLLCRCGEEMVRKIGGSNVRVEGGTPKFHLRAPKK